ncbi:MAG: preprotein translocase subunit SecG [Candidatus Hydrogenedentes bacterium]|nr:preprotein translocase subunit SecG [Candidatus Hydrogenedentota bacterium]
MLEAIFNSTVLWWLILLLYLPACLGLVVIVLLQKGKGAGFAGAFGVGGGSDTVFGPRSSKSLPQKITYAAAALFMLLALLMSTLSGRVGRSAAPEQVTEEEIANMNALFEQQNPAADAAAAPEGDAAAAVPAADAAAPAEAPAPAPVVVEATPVPDAAPAEAAPAEAAPAPAVEAAPAPEAAPVVETPVAPEAAAAAAEEHTTETAPAPPAQ